MNAELDAIQKRNQKVEADKAWETSWIRRLCIALMTYVIAALYMNTAGLSNPMLGAFVPTGGYLLSTVSLPFAKNFWINNFYKKQES
ncbi:MAG: hypothetical protein AAF988_07705 [Pseudomonadota bacterium]